MSRGLVANRKPAERRGWEDDSLKEVWGGSNSKRDGQVSEECPVPGAPPENTGMADLDVDMNAANDVPPLAEDDGLATAKSQFNNPFSQLKSVFPYMLDDTISGALMGCDVGSAMLYLTSTLPIPPTPTPRPSGSGLLVPPAPPFVDSRASGSGLRTIFDAPPLPSMVNLDSAATFIFSKLSKVFDKKGDFPHQDLIALLASTNGNLALTVSALQSAGLKFSWPEHVLANDWRDWADAAVTPQATTPVSTSLSTFTILADLLPSITYDKEASFLQHLFTDAGIALPADVTFIDLATTYQGQFPAMLMKLRVSHDMAFPDHWKEAFLMQSFSDWWFPSLPAATGQTTAPVISPTPVHFDTSHRMCTLQHTLIPTNTSSQPWVSLLTLTRSPPFSLLCRKNHLP